MALLDGKFIGKEENLEPGAIFDWCVEKEAIVVAVDAPCKWSQAGSSRLAERELRAHGIYCFATPTREAALSNRTGFYNWVLNGERLYRWFQDDYQLFNNNQKDPILFQTFPHAIVCSLAGRVVSAKPKSRVRRNVLRSKGYDDSSLPNIDFVDAALCAVAAEEFRRSNYQLYGNHSEGFILVPAPTDE